jgi:hypothetical protein
MSLSSTPNQTDFLTFLYGTVGIDPLALPSASTTISDAFVNASAIVSPDFAVIPGSIYSLMVYNLGADFIINYAPDQPGRTFFFDLRKTLGIGLFVPGVTTSSGDSGTSQSRLNPEFMKNLTLMDLQTLKTPYGRQYLAYAQMYGSFWGVS